MNNLDPKLNVLRLLAGKQQGSKHNPSIHDQQFKPKLITVEELLGEVAEQEGEDG